MDGEEFVFRCQYSPTDPFTGAGRESGTFARFVLVLPLIRCITAAYPPLQCVFNTEFSCKFYHPFTVITANRQNSSKSYVIWSFLCLHYSRLICSQVQGSVGYVFEGKEGIARAGDVVDLPMGKVHTVGSIAAF